MPKKSESVLIDAKDGEKRHYSSTEMFCSVPIWRDKRNISAGELFPASEATLLWLSDPSLPHPVDVHRVVEDDISELPKYVRQGYTIAIEPFDISIGKCAVIEDSFGTRLGLLDRGVMLGLSEAD